MLLFIEEEIFLNIVCIISRSVYWSHLASVIIFRRPDCPTTRMSEHPAFPMLVLFEVAKVLFKMTTELTPFYKIYTCLLRIRWSGLLLNVLCFGIKINRARPGFEPGTSPPKAIIIRLNPRATNDTWCSLFK